MPEVNFYLKNEGGAEKDRLNKKALIYLQFKYAGRRLVYSFGQKIEPKNWNKQTKRVKSNKATTADGNYLLNDMLEALAKACIKGYNTELVHGVPSPERLKKYLDAIVYQSMPEKEDNDLFALFDRFINGEIKNKGKEKTKNTLKNYVTAKSHLLAYCKATKHTLTYEDINLDFLYKFTTFLTKQWSKPDETKGLKQNSIAKTVTVLKTVMAEAVDLGYTDNMQFRHKKFSYTEEETDAVHLSEKEVIQLYELDLTRKVRLAQIRDLFVVGCFTGLRYSDYSNITADNIVESDGELFIKMITQKTKELVIIPCNPIVLDIFKKYDDSPNRLPRAISAQKFNEYLKEVCRIAGFSEKGRLSTAPTKQLWECVTSHTARRSFATNLYLQGFPVHELMKITGHKSEATFRKYIKVSKLETAKRLSEHIKKNWNGKLLRIAI